MLSSFPMIIPSVVNFTSLVHNIRLQTYPWEQLSTPRDASAEEQERWSRLSNRLKLERIERRRRNSPIIPSSLWKVMESRKLIGDPEFATSALCDHWNRKEENSTLSHFQFSASCLEVSTKSSESISSSSSSLCDDDTLSSFSSSSSCLSLSSTSSLLSQSELQEQRLPIKKGLSRFYEGKSRTFSSLSDVKSIEDLAKRENDYKKKDSRISPKATISKKHGRSCFATLVSKADSLL